MPGARKHHTEKFNRCVEQVVGKGHQEDAAFAICTTSLQNAGEPIFEGLESLSDGEMRALGDYDGHPFRGNQYDDGEGGGGDEKGGKGADRDEAYNKQYAERADGRSQKADDLTKSITTRADAEKAAEAHADASMAHAKAETAYRGTGNTEKAEYHAERQAYHDKQDRLLSKKARNLSAGGEERELLLLGAMGTVRRETLNDRTYLVVPVTALMEGVIHAVNAETPEFVGGDVLRKAAASWVGKPVTLGHPARGGTQCSAVDPDIRKASGIGVIMRSEVDDKNRLQQEAWIDEAKAKALHPQMYETLSNGGTEEVSVGAHVVTAPTGGAYNGKLYKGTWLHTTGDHLAFLPGGRGACSCAMGCGTHRAAAMRMEGETMELEGEAEMCECNRRGVKTRVKALGDFEGHPFRGNQYETGGGGGDSQKGDPNRGGTAPEYSKEEAYSRAESFKFKKAAQEKAKKANPNEFREGQRIGAEGGRLDLDTVNNFIDRDDQDAYLAGYASTYYRRKSDVYGHEKGWRGAAGYRDCPMCDGTGSKGGNPCEACAGEGQLRNNAERIKHEGGKYAVYSTDGKLKLAEHYSRVDAETHLTELEARLART